MKRAIFIISLLFFTTALFAQREDLRHEVRLSYGILSLPNGDRMSENDILAGGGFTANYMYRVANWFWVGANVNWQLPSDIHSFLWREYDFDGTANDFITSTRNRFFTFAPELRFSCHNSKRANVYFALSAGYGIYSAINKDFPAGRSLDAGYWFWNITWLGVNLNLGKKENFILGFEVGTGFRGAISIHGGYRF